MPVRRPETASNAMFRSSLTSRPRGRERNVAVGEQWPGSTPTASSSDLPASREASGQTGAGCVPGAGCWQVFGLTSAPAFAGFLLSNASQSRRDQCMPWRLFSLTAAGQPRNLTGFPFEPGHAPRHQHAPNLFASCAFVNPQGIDSGAGLSARPSTTRSNAMKWQKRMRVTRRLSACRTRRAFAR